MRNIFNRFRSTTSKKIEELGSVIERHNERFKSVFTNSTEILNLKNEIQLLRDRITNNECKIQGLEEIIKSFHKDKDGK